MHPLARFITAAIAATGFLVTAQAHAQQAYDIVVYGGTASGAIAAIQSARLGKSVVLIEPTSHIGGMTVSGLGQTDVGNSSVIGGLSRQFYRNVKDYYRNLSAWTHQQPETHAGFSKKEDVLWQFEPKVAEKVLGDMLAQSKIQIVLNERLDLKNGVKKEGPRIVSITMESGKSFVGSIFIDATYEGDLMAKAGVSYAVGREANSQYGETLNGIQIGEAKKHQLSRGIDPYREKGNPASGLLPGIDSGAPGHDGQGDKRVQAYNFRLCLTTVPENRVPFAKPEGYDPLQYELLFRNFEAGEKSIPLNFALMPNLKTDSNNNRGFSSDFIGQNYDYPEANYVRRDQIVRAHQLYLQGLLWTLANHPRVPEAIREKMSQYGLAKDEFVQNGNWPWMLYVREARRMVSDYVVTEQDCRHDRTANDSIGVASYKMDSHHVRRYVNENGEVRNEGDVQVAPTAPFPISYRALVPRAGECTNLLVPVCMSASHIAYGSIRMEPVFMVLGQSSATAAAIAIDDRVSVQSISYGKLCEKLLSDKQILTYRDSKIAAPAK